MQALSTSQSALSALVRCWLLTRDPAVRGKGTEGEITYEGQLCPALVVSSPPPTIPPYFRPGSSPLSMPSSSSQIISITVNTCVLKWKRPSTAIAGQHLEYDVLLSTDQGEVYEVCATTPLPHLSL